MTGKAPEFERQAGVEAALSRRGSRNSTVRAVNRVLLWSLLAVVLLSPVPFGAILPWSYTLIAAAGGVLLAVWAAGLLLTGAPVAVSIGRIPGPAFLFSAVLVWAAVQAAPWSPDAWHNPVWAETAAVLGRPLPGAISVDPDATRTGIMRLMSYAAIFWLALQLGRSERNARRIFLAIALAGLAYAAYGIAVEITGSGTILWFDKERYRDSLTATFRYKNAYAAFAGFGLLCTLALLIGALGRHNYATMGPRERARTLLTMLFERVWYLVPGLMVLFSALMLSNSRGGAIAVVLGIACLGVCLWRAGAVRLPYGRSFLGGIAAIAAVYIVLSGGTVLDRLSTTPGGDDIRTSIYRDTLTAIGERPLLGWGLGSFEGVFAKFQGPEFRTRSYRAHSEYLDNALGLGIPATVALVMSVGWLGVRCARGALTRRRNQIYPATGFAAVVLAGTQSTVDFTLQEPAVAATFALILGTACAQSWSSRD